LSEFDGILHISTESTYVHPVEKPVENVNNFLNIHILQTLLTGVAVHYLVKRRNFRRRNMLLVYRSMAELPFGKLMEIYAQSNCGREQERSVSAEQEFYAYLRQCFFTLPGARYFLWEVHGRPVSAVRCEGYRDGVLLTALETAPDCRGKGYATDLLMAVVKQMTGRVYVHIRNDNEPSQRVHLHCGFTKMKSGARLLDGSYSGDYDTYMIDC
jgi:GNAT superfamily N-acetyltransferase